MSSWKQLVVVDLKDYLLQDHRSRGNQMHMTEENGEITLFDLIVLLGHLSIRSWIHNSSFHTTYALNKVFVSGFRLEEKLR